MSPIKHGMSRTPTYRSWASMMHRCYNPKVVGYPRYGGAGISVCEEWHRFESFLRDMGERPPGTTIDRIDNSKGYSPSNCRWTDWQTQLSNRSCCKQITFRGESKTATQWARELKITPDSLRHRLKRGKTLQQIAANETSAPRTNACCKFSNDEVKEIRASTMTTKELAARFLVHPKTIWKIRRNLSYRQIGDGSQHSETE